MINEEQQDARTDVAMKEIISLVRVDKLLDNASQETFPKQIWIPGLRFTECDPKIHMKTDGLYQWMWRQMPEVVPATRTAVRMCHITWKNLNPAWETIFLFFCPWAKRLGAKLPLWSFTTVSTVSDVVIQQLFVCFSGKSTFLCVCRLPPSAS